MLGTLVMAGGNLCAMTRSSTLCGRSTLLGKRGLSALGRAAATLLTQERHAQDMSLEIAADMCGLLGVPAHDEAREREDIGISACANVFSQNMNLKCGFPGPS